MAFSTYYLWAGIVLLMLEFVHFYRQRKLADERTKLFYGMLGVSMIICFGGILLTAELSGKMAGVWYIRAMVHVVYMAQCCLPFLLLKTLCLLIHEPEAHCCKVGSVVWEIGSILILMNPWTGWISYPGEDGLLHVGQGYPFFVWGMMAFYIVDFVILLVKRKQMKQRQATALAEAIALMIIGILLQNVFRYFLAVGFTAALMSAVLYFALYNPYAYVDFVTHVLNEDYFRYWIEEKFRQKKDVFLLCIKLTGLERIRIEYGMEQEVIRVVAEQLWNISPGHAVFRVRYDKYILQTKNRKEHQELVKRVEKLFSAKMTIEGYSVCCPAVWAEIEHAESVCHENWNEIMNYLRFLIYQVEKNHEVQCISCSMVQQEKFLYKQSVERYVQTALNQDLFEVWYQLVYSVKEKRFVSMEALSRLHHPELG